MDDVDKQREIEERMMEPERDVDDTSPKPEAKDRHPEDDEPQEDTDALEKPDIRKLGLKSIADYFQLDESKLTELPKGTLIHLHQKARLGMSFEREMGIGERSVEANTLRVMTLVATDKKELKNLIKKSLPQYSPSP